MPIDFSDILGALLDGAQFIGEPSWPGRSTPTDHTPPIVNGKRVVTYARGLKAFAWACAIAALGAIGAFTWGQPLPIMLCATTGAAVVFGWTATEITRRRLQLDSTHLYDRRLFLGERKLAWSDLSEAVAFQLGGGRLRFSSGDVVRVSSHMNGAWLLMEAARRVLRQGGVELLIQPRSRLRRRSNR